MYSRRRVLPLRRRVSPRGGASSRCRGTAPLRHGAGGRCAMRRSAGGRSSAWRRERPPLYCMEETKGAGYGAGTALLRIRRRRGGLSQGARSEIGRGHRRHRPGAPRVHLVYSRRSWNCIVGQQISTKAQTAILEPPSPGAFGDVARGDHVACPTTTAKSAPASRFARRPTSKGRPSRCCPAPSTWTVWPNFPTTRCAAGSGLPGIGVWMADADDLLDGAPRHHELRRPGHSSGAAHAAPPSSHYARAVCRSTAPRRYSPHGTVASLYLWAIAGGAVPGMRDYAPMPKKPATGRA